MPFTIKSEDKDPVDAIFVVDIECPSVPSMAIKDDQGTNVCPKTTKTGQPSEVNKFLSALSYSSSELFSGKFDVKYSYKQISEGNVKMQSSFIQTCQVATEIPIRMFEQDIKLTSDTGSVEYLILSIDQDYFSNTDVANLSVVFEKKPEWIGSTFVGPDFYVKIQTNASAAADQQLTVSIEDTRSGLKTKEVTFVIDFLDLKGKSVSKNGSQFYFLVFLVIFALAIILLIFIIWYSNQKVTHRQNLKESIDGQKRTNELITTNCQSFQEKSTVLTDSIINWNQRMVQKHKAKCSIVFDNSELKERSKLNAIDMAQSYGRFDESDHAEEFAREMSEDNFEDISEIHQDISSVKSQDFNQKSSFLDEFKFWLFRVEN